VSVEATAVSVRERPGARPHVDAASPIPPAPPTPASPRAIERAITCLIVFGPLLAVVLAVLLFWGHGVSARDLVLAVVFYAIAGHGVTIGFHRLFAHRSFKARRPLKIALAVAGSMAFEGAVIGWVANHRLHHTFADRPGDPHSPALHGSGVAARWRGMWHAHMGWFFRPPVMAESRYAPDLIADGDLRIVSRLFPLWCVLSLALPFSVGWAWGGGLAAAGTALLWAGGVRICVLHHVTWSINSVCHAFGRRPFTTRDKSTNVAALAVVSMGESWHNAHHAFPALARHGVDRGQRDSSAALIRVFERVGWAQDARWPDVARLDERRTPSGPA
jgi:stearoyl-CoA desaturase (delta-9 desaturase)